MLKRVCVLAIAVVVVMGLMLAGCKDNTPAPAPPADTPATEAPATDTPAAGGDFTFGYIAWKLTDVWNQYGMEAFEYCAAQKGVTVKSVDAQNDPERQASLAQEMINAGVDAVSLFPCTPEVGATIVRMCNEAGIPIAIENIFLPDDASAGEVVGQIACRYSDIGYAAIEYAAGAFPGCKMLWVQGAPGLGVTEDYAVGVDDALTKFGDKVEVVGYVNGEFATEPSYNVTMDFINSGKEFDIIFAQNDQIAFGAYNALKENGREKDVPIISTGGSPQGFEMMQQDQQYANMTAPVNIQGAQVFKFLWDYKNGDTTTGTKIPLPIIAIDKTNIGEWIHWDNTEDSFKYVGL